MLILPPPLFALLLARGVWFWAGGRAMLFAVMAFAAQMGGRFVPPVRLGVVESCWFVALCASLMLVDIARRRERLLFANHGAGLPVLGIVGAFPAAIAEAVVTVTVPA